MGKYTSRSNKTSRPKMNTVNPYMRGIGCLLIVVVPIFAYAVGSTLAASRFGIQVLPISWYGYINIPPSLANFSGLYTAASYLARIPHLGATLAIATVVIIVVGGIMSIVFGYMYSLLGPSRYGSLDVPPPRVKTKRYKR